MSSAEGNEDQSAVVGMLLSTVFQTLDDCTPWFIAECIESENGKPKGAEWVESLRTADVLRLRDACAEVNDLGEVLDLEKKALWGIAEKVLQTVRQTQSLGGSESSPHSPEPTAGLSVE